MPPVWNQRAPSSPKRCSQSTSPARSAAAAVCPRSETPTAPRTPKPRSVKLSPLRAARPVPSKGAQETNVVSTPPCRMQSSTSRPTSLSTSAVTIALRSPKHRRSPRATLYSPPPSQTRKDLAFRIRPSPGSKRSITSPSETRSNRQSSSSRRPRLSAVVTRRAQLERLGRQSLDGGVVPGGEQLGGDHPAAADRRHGRMAEVRPLRSRRRSRRSARSAPPGNGPASAADQLDSADRPRPGRASRA